MIFIKKLQKNCIIVLEPQAEKSEMGKKEKKYRLYIDKLEQLNNDFNANKEK